MGLDVSGQRSATWIGSGDWRPQGVHVHMHNTLASSDYGLLEKIPSSPGPITRAAVLWRKLMGTVVLDSRSGAGTQSAPVRPLSSRSARRRRPTRNQPGSGPAQSLELSGAGESAYTLSAGELTGKQVQMNGSGLASDAHGELPP